MERECVQLRSACSEPKSDQRAGFQARARCGMIASMDRDATLSLLREHKPALEQRFGVRRLTLFGSVARGTARADSDVDVLVGFDNPPTPEQYFGAQFYLEDLLGCAVDLVTETALRPQFRPYVERDAIAIA